MTKKRAPAGSTEGTAGSDSGKPASPQERRILQHGSSALTGTTGSSLTTKSDSLFVLCAEDGDIDTGLNSGYGLYFHDTRFLDRATLRLNGQRLSVLLSSDEHGSHSICELTNPDLTVSDGKKRRAGTAGAAPATEVIRKETLGVRRVRKLGAEMTEEIQLHNFNANAYSVDVQLEFAAQFTNMFVVRGSEPGKRGRLYGPAWKDGSLSFRYLGADDRTRTTTLSFNPAPDMQHDGAAGYRLHLAPGKNTTITVTAALEDAGTGDLEPRPHAVSHDKSPFSTVTVTSDNPLFDRVLQRSFDDLKMLVTREHGDTYFAAGIPWFVALFGRDSLITCLQTLAYDPSIAANTLRVLAQYQGQKQDSWRDEEPGKILHELRVGEKANLHEVPQTPYYGSVDATPLFIILLAEYVRWSGDLSLWRELANNVDRALHWIDDYGDHNGDGFTDYASKSSSGLVNQGWKDSGNSITNADGSLATPPIALVEIQGYVYRAKKAAAWLFEQIDDSGRAGLLQQQAEDLRERFQEAYWMADRKYLAVAIEKGGQQAKSITSNAGQALWSGIVSPAHARAVAETLLGERMFSGWGIRTLAEGEAAFNPIDYQVGSVWPHDNSLIAAGLKRYGEDKKAVDVFTGIFEAATKFKNYQLPEVFAGFSRKQYSVPVRYPVACSPQAWAAGAIPYLLRTCLGLHPNAIEQSLHIARPMLPPWLGSVTVRGLRVGAASIDLRYHRTDEATLVAVLERHGSVRVEIEY